MATKRKKYVFRSGDIIDVEEYHDGRYGAPGMPRQKKKKVTKEQMIQINLLNKARKAKRKMLAYMNFGDYFATWTYSEEKRPEDMKAALRDFQKAMRKVRKEYQKRGYELYWFRNIERGTRGGWHVHLVINRIPGTASILEEAWEHGGTYSTSIRKSKFYDEDFTKLANYMTKNENSVVRRADGSRAKSRIKEASYWTSKNMPLPDPQEDKLIRWQEEPKPKKGYYIVKESFYEGIAATGYKYRRYTMIRLHRRI